MGAQLHRDAWNCTTLYDRLAVDNEDLSGKNPACFNLWMPIDGTMTDSEMDLPLLFHPGFKWKESLKDAMSSIDALQHSFPADEEFRTQNEIQQIMSKGQRGLGVLPAEQP